jgi:hypothetical protein
MMPEQDPTYAGLPETLACRWATMRDDPRTS